MKDAVMSPSMKIFLRVVGSIAVGWLVAMVAFPSADDFCRMYCSREIQFGGWMGGDLKPPYPTTTIYYAGIILASTIAVFLSLRQSFSSKKKSLLLGIVFVVIATVLVTPKAMYANLLDNALTNADKTIQWGTSVNPNTCDSLIRFQYPPGSTHEPLMEDLLRRRTVTELENMWVQCHYMAAGIGNECSEMIGGGELTWIGDVRQAAYGDNVYNSPDSINWSDERCQELQGSFEEEMQQ